MARVAQVKGFGEQVSIPSKVRSKPRKRMSVWRRMSPLGFTATLLVLLASGLSGCRVAEETVKLPMRAVTAVTPSSKSSVPDPAFIQTQLQRFADEYSSRTTAALDDYARIMETDEARSQALRWKIASAFAAVSIASGPNPQANLLDFLALTTVTRIALEEVWVKTTDGAAFQPWLDASRALETNAWKLAEGVFTPEQQRETRNNIQSWWDANPGEHSNYFVHPEEFSALIRQTGEKAKRPGSVFSFVGLDPTAGLDPAVREVTRTRLFAERAMFMVQRLPFLVRWQTELLADELLHQAEITNALTSADRLSRAAESVSQTAALLPDRFGAERKALTDELTAQEGKLRELSVDVRRTLAAGEKMSASLNTTLITFDALMKRFGVGEPSTTPPDTNSPPFNILDYARTAEEIAAMAQQLDTLIKDAGSTLDSPALDKRIADLNAVSVRAREDARSVLNHAFLLAAGLIVLAFACASVYKRYVSRDAGVPASRR